MLPRNSLADQDAIGRFMKLNHLMIGAGSLVPPNKVLRSGYLYMGRPVEEVRALSEVEIAHFAYSAAHYVRLMGRYLGNPINLSAACVFNPHPA